MRVHPACAIITRPIMRRSCATPMATGSKPFAITPKNDAVHLLAPSGSATIVCCSLLWLPGHYKCSLPAQFPMKSVATAATDGLGSGSCKAGDSR